MKTIRFFLSTMLLALMLNANNIQAQTNLVQNGGFEMLDPSNQPSNWSFSSLGSGNAISVVTDVNDVFDGQNSLRISTSSGSGPVMEQTTDVSDIITARDEYTFSLNYKYITTSANEVEGGMYYAVAFMDATSNPIEPFIYVMGGVPAAEGIWLPISESIIVPQNAKYLYITLGINYNSEVIVDNVSVTKVGDTGISSNRLSLPIRIQNDNIIVSSEVGSNIEVYNALGIRLQSKTAVSEETEISGLPQGQVLIVRSGNAVAKVAL